MRIPEAKAAPQLGRPRTVVAYALRPFFPRIREAWGRDRNISKNIGDFLGMFGGSPRSSPRGRLGFAEGKAERTSMFVRARALEGRECSQKAISKAYFLIISGN